MLLLIQVSLINLMSGTLPSQSPKSCTRKQKNKSMDDLRAWIPSITNHLWWCAASCGGDEVVLLEKWQSLTKHVANEHEWIGE